MPLHAKRTDAHFNYPTHTFTPISHISTTAELGGPQDMIIQGMIEATGLTGKKAAMFEKIGPPR